MKPFSIEEIIKLIFHNNPEQRDKLLAEYPTYDEAKKSDATQILSDQFLTYLDDLAILKYGEMMDEVTEGTRQISGDLMQQAYRAVHEDLRQVLSGKKQDDQRIKDLQEKLINLGG